MKIKIIAVLMMAIVLSAFVSDHFTMNLSKATTIDSLGACQGISYQQGHVYLLWRPGSRGNQAVRYEWR